MITRRVCVLVPSSRAGISGPLNRIGSSLVVMVMACPPPARSTVLSGATRRTRGHDAAGPAAWRCSPRRRAGTIRYARPSTAAPSLPWPESSGGNAGRGLGSSTTRNSRGRGPDGGRQDVPTGDIMGVPAADTLPLSGILDGLGRLSPVGGVGALTAALHQAAPARWADEGILR